VRAVEELHPYYEKCPDVRLRKEFRRVCASKRRLYAKTLMGASQIVEARRQLVRALTNVGFVSFMKSLGLLFLTFLPKQWQPSWPSSSRTLRVSE